jgi:hypothetical protein
VPDRAFRDDDLMQTKNLRLHAAPAGTAHARAYDETNSPERQADERTYSLDADVIAELIRSAVIFFLEQRSVDKVNRDARVPSPAERRSRSRRCGR